MLSQRMYALSAISMNENLEISNQAKTELSNAVTTLDNIYDLFENGGSMNQIENSTDYIKAADDIKIKNKLKEIKPIFQEHKRLCNIIINEPTYISKGSLPAESGVAFFSITHDSVQTEELSYTKPINPKVKDAVQKLQHLAIDGMLLKNNQQLVAFFSETAVSHRNTNELLFFIFSSMGVVVIVFNFLLLQFFVVNPVNKIAKAAEQIAQGNINTSISHNIKDGLGLIVNSITTLTGNLRKAAEFIVNIGKGDFDAKYDVPVSEGIDEKDNLSAALLNMRDRLKNVYDEDKKRNWTTEGFARFGEILRLNTDDIKKLSDDIISNLIKYLQANQGSIFIINDNSSDDIHLELTACYAWNRKKYMENKITIGEGLVGQVWQEGESIFMTDVPDNYVRITSGLGEANPKCILIAPLKINEHIYGIIEIASFKVLEKYEIDFVEKLGESIASTISGLKINVRTKKLLEESQQMTEELKAQEEEVRQNIEEMTATQEELQRKEIETQKLLSQSKAQEEQLRQHMKEMATQQADVLKYREESEAQRKATHAMVVFSKTDIDGNITYVNDEFLKLSKYSREELIGKNHRILKSGHQADTFYTGLWNTISNGKIWRNEIKNKAKDGSFYWVDTAIAPILDKEGKPKEYVAQGFVITDRKKKEEEVRTKIEELQKELDECRKRLK
jgi:PAS domain S-box-containing protein